MITYDGHRSQRRKHLGHRTLASIVALGLPAKSMMYDGFRVNATNLGGIKKGRITAPAGALVACSQPGSVQVVECDYWLGGASSRADAYICNAAFQPGQESYVYINPNTSEVGHVLFEPEDTHSLPDAGLLNPPWEAGSHPNTPPQIGLMPFLGESYVLTMAGRDATRKRTESLLTPYLLAGKADKRIAVASEDSNSTLSSMESVFALPGSPYRAAGTWTEDRPLLSNDDFIAGSKYLCAVVYEISASGLGRSFFFADTMYAGVPDATLRSRMTTAGAYDVTQTLASHVFALDANTQPTLLTVVDARDASLHSGLSGTEPWTLFFSIYTMGAGSIATWSLASFAAVLNGVDPSHAVGVWPAVDVGRAHAVLSQLVGWPMRRENLPPDTVTFHGPNGDIYTWSRRYGAVKFATTGLTTTTLTMPPEVTGENGVRPELSYAGNGLYLCVCNKPGKKKLPSEYADQAEADADWCGIKAIYVGSPFSGWSAVTMPAPAYRLHHVRPVTVTEDTIMLLGVLRDLEAQPTYYMAAFREGVWTIVAKLPVSVSDPERVSWSTALFGDDPLVASMASFPSPPAITPQMPALPYSVYAAVIP